ncbi:hypothetical protein FB45DRAFT_1013421 [Roridomyces roridus]|uniref:Uncharacterized protein n=1 Tax=Roridomyces roridus TaxID=1738132 RepID=A0AAD7AYJ8_9AGAR|nr:hypothetical protein FB45DRAFT_1013421 [Roridomyces roridus]
MRECVAIPDRRRAIPNRVVIGWVWIEMVSGSKHAIPKGVPDLMSARHMISAWPPSSSSSRLNLPVSPMESASERPPSYSKTLLKILCAKIRSEKRDFRATVGLREDISLFNSVRPNVGSNVRFRFRLSVHPLLSRPFLSPRTSAAVSETTPRERPVFDFPLTTSPFITDLRMIASNSSFRRPITESRPNDGTTQLNNSDACLAAFHSVSVSANSTPAELVCYPPSTHPRRLLPFPPFLLFPDARLVT